MNCYLEILGFQITVESFSKDIYSEQKLLTQHTKRNILMKKLLCLIISAIVVFAATGCTTIDTNRSGAQIEITCQKDFEPTVKVSEQAIEAEASVSSLFGIFTWGVNNTAVGVDFGTGASANLIPFFKGAAEIAREGAVYNACVNNNADFLVTPRYYVTTNDYIVFKTIHCKVIGFPGQIVKVTPIDD